MLPDGRKAQRQSYRKHITTACTACRESKVRCDGNRPKCGNCAKSLVKDCIYRQGEDKRRLSLRKSIEIFYQRTQQLELFIVENGLSVPPAQPDHEAPIKQMLDIIEVVPLPPSELNDHVDKSTSGDSSWADIAINLNTSALHTQSTYFEADKNDHTLDPLAFPNYKLDFTTNVGSSTRTDDSELVFSELVDLHTVPDTFVSLQGISSQFSSSPDNFAGEAFDGPESLQRPNHTNPLSKNDEIGTTAISPIDPLCAFEDEEFDEDQEQIIQQIADRLGSVQITDDGRFHYFGATSNLKLMENLPKLTAELAMRPTQAEAVARLQQENLDCDIDSADISRLLNSYFELQSVGFPMVDRAAFEEQRALHERTGQSYSFYSRMLEDAMCALSALCQIRSYKERETFGAEYFARRAQIWLEAELESPSVATAQGLAILSQYMAAITRDTKGWIYIGMAVRIVFDIALHLDVTSRQRNGRMPATEWEARKTAFWGIYVADHLWGSYLGRPPAIQNLDGVTITKPYEFLPPIELTHLTESLTSSGQSSNEQVGCESSKDRTQLVFRYWVLLCENVSKANHNLFHSLGLSNQELQARTEMVVQKLQELMASIPKALQVDMHCLNSNSKVSPQVILLHMQYHHFQINIHRPFMARYGTQPYPPVGPGHLHARSMAINSAVTISRLLRHYRSQGTLQPVNINIISPIFSSALILVSALISEIDDYDTNELSAHLSACSQALAELGTMFSSASRALDILFSTKRCWQANFVAATSSKRRSSALATKHAKRAAKT